MQLVAIGGSDAGISAVLRARELDPSAQVTVVLADPYPNFSICGIPYYVSREVGLGARVDDPTRWPGNAGGSGRAVRQRAAPGSVRPRSLDRLCDGHDQSTVAVQKATRIDDCQPDDSLAAGAERTTCPSGVSSPSAGCGRPT